MSSNNSTFNDLKRSSKSEYDEKIFFVWAFSILVFIGIIGNLISLFVFLRSIRHVPKILARTSLTLLTLSNLMYLIIIWYYKVLKKIHKRLYLVDSDVLVCKSVIYFIHLASTLNALITVR